MLTELLACRNVHCCDMFLIQEVRRGTADEQIVHRRVCCHVVVCRGQAVFDTALQHTRLPELGLEIQFRTVDIRYLLAVDIQQLGLRTNVVGVLAVRGLVVVPVIIDVHRQLAFQLLVKGMGEVQVRRVLWCLVPRPRVRDTPCRVADQLVHVPCLVP